MNAKSMPRSNPRLGWRLALTAIVVLACILTIGAYSHVQGVIEGPLAVKQLQDDPIEYAIGQGIARANVPGMIATGAGVVLMAVWGSYVLHYAFHRQGALR
ncbi:MAG: hypothetical protein JJ992_09275 [Planctomycetes bacterium]|nr:hypothetical protein [Planctomycetota bacterium]